MVDTHSIRDVVIKPGEFAVGDASCRLRAILGSCVSITLWHREKRVGAMSHFMLAQRDKPFAGALDARYGDEALKLMLAELQRRGVLAAQCEAKVFGGGDMFPEQRLRSKDGVGRVNGCAAKRLLAEHNIPIVSESLFGIGHRQIVFEVATGDVWARQVQPNSGLMPLAGDLP